jgi:hypothetical protein
VTKEKYSPSPSGQPSSFATSTPSNAVSTSSADKMGQTMPSPRQSSWIKRLFSVSEFLIWYSLAVVGP